MQNQEEFPIAKRNDRQKLSLKFAYNFSFCFRQKQSLLLSFALFIFLHHYIRGRPVMSNSISAEDPIIIIVLEC